MHIKTGVTVSVSIYRIIGSIQKLLSSSIALFVKMRHGFKQARFNDPVKTSMM